MTSNPSARPVNYRDPPVIEVVCGVTYPPVEGLTLAHIGRFWATVSDEYTQSEEQPPIAAAIERFDGGEADEPPFELLSPRLWLVNSTNDHLIQVQRDRFLCNWRKVNPSDPYPRYDSLSEKFFGLYAKFAAFVESSVGNKIAPRQYEITYVNHIVSGELWKSTDHIGRVFPDLEWRNPGGRFLPAPESVIARYSFRLPEVKGRLHTKLTTGLRTEDKLPVFVLELTARGFEADMRAWFDLGHDWIVRGFEDLTNSETPNRVWGKVP